MSSAFRTIKLTDPRFERDVGAQRRFFEIHRQGFPAKRLAAFAHVMKAFQVRSPVEQVEQLVGPVVRYRNEAPKFSCVVFRHGSLRRHES